MKQVIQLLNPRNVALTPSNRMGSDIYLVSYPRSGNTWLRFLIANAIKLYHQSERNVNFFSIADIIPDIHVARHISTASPFNSDCFPRIIKSHCSYNPYYQRAILLIRDPKDVMTSYYYHLLANKSIPSHMSLSLFIRSKRFGIWAWRRHTVSWLDNHRRGQNTHIFLYEHLLNDTSIFLGKIMNIFGFDFPSELLDMAVDLSSVDRMRQSELLTRPTIQIKKQSSKFVRVAKAQGGKELTLGDRSYIEKASEDIFDELKRIL